MIIREIVLFTALIFLSSCGSESDMTPKPRAYPKIDFPAQEYETLSVEDCPFTFTANKSAIIEMEQQKVQLNENSSDCWFNLYYPTLNARFHFSYYQMKERNQFEKLRSDAYRIVNQINKRSDYMDEFPIHKDNSVHGILFDFEGPSASPMQFFVTDSSSHFVRTSLYIKSNVDVDSLKPVIGYMENEMEEILRTFEWKNK